MAPSRLSNRFESSYRSARPGSEILLQISKRLGCPLLTARLPCGTGEFRYRCFLPDLTGFAAPSCTGPNYQQSTSISENSVRLNALLSASLPPSSSGGEGGIRTPGTLLEYTRFPVVHLQPLGHLSLFGISNLSRRALLFFNAQRLQNVSTRDFAIRELSQGISTSKNELPY